MDNNDFELCSKIYAHNYVEWMKEVSKKRTEIFNEIRLRFDCTGSDIADIDNLITELLLLHKCAVACDSVVKAIADKEVHNG